MQNAQTLVTQYLNAFNETNTDRRRELLEALYAPRTARTPTRTWTSGRPEQIDAFVEQTQPRVPVLTFTLGGAIDARHNQARFQWHAGPADAPAAYIGFDVIVGEDGRIRSVYGFMDTAPAA